MSCLRFSGSLSSDGRGLKHADRDNQAPLHEHYEESSTIVDGSDSGNDGGGGTARTLANSADAKGYYGFLLPSEDRSQGSVEEAKVG